MFADGFEHRHFFDSLVIKTPCKQIYHAISVLVMRENHEYQRLLPEAVEKILNGILSAFHESLVG